MLRVQVAPLAIVKFFRWFRNNGEAVVVEPIDQRPQREELLILDDHGVIECAHQRTATLKFRQQALVVDIEAERPCGGMSVDTVYEQRELRSVPCHCFASGRGMRMAF